MGVAADTNFEELPHDHPMAASVLTVLASNGLHAVASGSCVLVGQNVALCARHVTDDFVRLFHGYTPTENYRVTYSIFARGFSGGKWRIFSVNRIFNVMHTDVVALHVSPVETESEEIEWPRVEIDVALPAHGTRVISYGHIDPIGEIVDAEQGILHWGARLVASRGVIRRVFLRRRDRYFVNFPSFQFDAQVNASMSGGPIFREDGTLIGLNSTSLAAGSPEEQHASFGMLLWPALGLRFEALNGKPVVNIAINLFDDLCTAGVITAQNRKMVSVIGGREGADYHVQTRHEPKAILEWRSTGSDSPIRAVHNGSIFAPETDDVLIETMVIFFENIVGKRGAKTPTCRVVLGSGSITFFGSTEEGRWGNGKTVELLLRDLESSRTSAASVSESQAARFDRELVSRIKDATLTALEEYHDAHVDVASEWQLQFFRLDETLLKTTSVKLEPNEPSIAD